MQFPLQIVFQLNVYDVTGNLIVQIGPTPTIFIYNTNGTLSSSIANADGTDSFGNAYYEGYVAYGNAGTKTDVQISSGGILFRSRPPAVTYDANGFIDILVNPDAANNVRPQLTMGAPSLANGQGTAAISLEASSRNGVLKPRVTIGAFDDAVSTGTFVAINGTLVGQFFNGVTETQRNWTTLSLAAGWASAGILPQYYIDALGFVHLEGSLSRGAGTPADGNVMATLPSEARPRRDILTFLVFDVVATIGRMVITASGNIQVFDAPNNLPVLDDHSFSTSQTI